MTTYLDKGGERTMTTEVAMAYLDRMAGYFEMRLTGGEDSAHWSNVYNAENCRIIARMLSRLDTSTPQPNVDEGDGK